MSGEFNFQKFILFLKSFWGLLASITVILPTIIYFINGSQAKASVLSDYYLGVPTTFCLLTIPVVFLFEDKLASVITARKLALILIVLSMIFLFSFLTIKNFYIGDKSYVILGENGVGKVEIDENREGQIVIATYKFNNDPPVKKEQRVNVLELISLFFYTITIVSLTAAFSGLGVFLYVKNRASSQAGNVP